MKTIADTVVGVTKITKASGVPIFITDRSINPSAELRTTMLT
ncbi:MAG: hypothetical protein ABJQ39_04060 [Winogradskyella arenosi]